MLFDMGDMSFLDVVKWLLPGSAILAGASVFFRWLTLSWRSDLETRASKLDDLSRFERRLKDHYGENGIKEFRGLIDDVKRPALVSLAKRMYIIKNRKSWFDWFLVLGGAFMTATVILSLSSGLKAPQSVLTTLGFTSALSILVFAVNAWIEDRAAKTGSKELVENILSQAEDESPKTDDESGACVE